MGQLDKSTVARGIAWNMAFAAPAKLLFPIIGILIARSVGSESMGGYAVLTTIFAVTELLREGGLSSTYIADRKLDEHRTRSYAGASIGSAGLFSLILIAASYPLAQFFRLPHIASGIMLGALGVCVGGLVTIPNVILQREVKFRELGLADFVATLVSYLVALILALSGFGFTSLVIQLITRVLVFSYLVLRASTFIKPSFDKEAIKIIGTSMANLGANLAYFIYSTFDYLLITKLVGPKPNGSYFAAFNVASKPVDLITVPVNRTVFVAYSRDDASPQRQADIWTRTVGLLMLVTMPFYGLMAVHASTIMGVLYSKDFAASGPALSILSLYLGCRAFGIAAGSALVATGHPKLHTMGWLVGYVVAGIGLYLTWQHITLISIVWSLTAGAVAVYASFFIALTATLPPDRAQTRVLLKRLAGGATTASLVAATRLLPIHAYFQVGVALFGGAIIHVAVMSIVLGKNPLRRGGLRELLKSA